MLNPDKMSETESNSVEVTTLIELASDVVSSYVSNNPVSTTELPNLIGEVYSSLSKLANSETPISQHNTKPAVPIKKSLHDDYIICLEDGKKFKSLKRHLRSHYDLSPEQYREKWGLPADYPMVAPNYAEARSRLARQMGLGRKPGTKIKKRA
ncbi:MAG: MucR family transcriptional regulator [Pseudomonadota bacterium]